MRASTGFSIGLAALTLIAAPALAKPPADAWIVKPQWVAAHEAFLASDALQGRGSATRDEAIAAAYVASQFQGYGLKPAPGMSGYLQTAEIIKPRLNGSATLTVGGAVMPGVTLLMAGSEGVTGKLTVALPQEATDLPAADVVLASSRATVMGLARAARQKHVKLLIVRDGDQAQQMFKGMGGVTSMASYLEGEPAPQRPAVVAVPAEIFDKLATEGGAEVALSLPPLTLDKTATTNAIGYLPGSDPKAGVILLSAHLDHLGVRKDGTIMHGANDDASGTTAVLELAHAMAAAQLPRRGVLFVAYGSEEIGEYGSLYFAAHPPVPLSTIVANIEFEMIGAQDPKLPDGVMMMTGFDRSNLGPALKAHGALVTADPYPQQHFFERSDNYQLALTGVVAHTLSGWAVTPTYHQPTDTLENLNLPFMTRAIQSLIEPVRWLADSDFQPQWAAGGRPTK
jgi:aminopeptidase YwaD